MWMETTEWDIMWSEINYSKNLFIVYPSILDTYDLATVEFIIHDVNNFSPN